MIAQIIHFPHRGQFVVRVDREGQTWLVICREHSWLFGDRNATNAESIEIAGGFGFIATAAS
jgi:hypothetical protein